MDFNNLDQQGDADEESLASPVLGSMASSSLDSTLEELSLPNHRRQTKMDSKLDKKKVEGDTPKKGKKARRAQKISKQGSGGVAREEDGSLWEEAREVLDSFFENQYEMCLDLGNLELSAIPGLGRFEHDILASGR